MLISGTLALASAACILVPGNDAKHFKIFISYWWLDVELRLLKGNLVVLTRYIFIVVLVISFISNFMQN